MVLNRSLKLRFNLLQLLFFIYKTKTIDIISTQLNFTKDQRLSESSTSAGLRSPVVELLSAQIARKYGSLMTPKSALALAHSNWPLSLVTCWNIWERTCLREPVNKLGLGGEILEFGVNYYKCLCNFLNCKLTERLVSVCQNLED